MIDINKLMTGDIKEISKAVGLAVSNDVKLNKKKIALYVQLSKLNPEDLEYTEKSTELKELLVKLEVCSDANVFDYSALLDL